MKHQTKVLIGVLSLFLIIVAAIGGYLFYNYQKSQQELNKLKQNSTNAAQQQVSDVKKKVEALMVLPSNEEPTLATVTDIDKLKNQQFFSQAMNGDQVLIYPKSSKAILYRPSINKIVEVASVNIGSQDQTTGTQAQTKVAIYNGSTVKGAAETAQKTISEKLQTVSVIATANAQKDTYGKTIVVDISGTHKQDAADLAKLLDGTVGSLPQGETKPTNADIIIILGSK